MYVALDKSDSVAVVDLRTWDVTGTIKVGHAPTALAMDRNGTRVVVSNAGSKFLSVIDTGTHTVADIPLEDAKFGLAAGSEPRYVYGTHPLVDRLSIVDIVQRRVAGSIATPRGPWLIESTRDGAKAYLTSSEGMVTIDTAANTVVSVTGGLGFLPRSVTCSGDGRRVFVANLGSDTVSVIDAAANALIATIPVGGHPHWLRSTPDGRFVYVAAAADTGFVSVIDAERNVELHRIPVGKQPVSLAF